MNQTTLSWLKFWRNILLFFLGFPTLGLGWSIIYAFGYNDPWQIQLAFAIESWLHNLRKVTLIILGFPTLGFTWFLVNKFEEPCLISWRLKYSSEQRSAKSRKKD